MTAPISHTMGARDWAMLLTLSVIWGSSFFLHEIALRDMQPFTIVAVRLVLAAVVLNALILLRGQRLNFSWPAWKALFVMALLGNVIPFVMVVWGQAYITASLASILNATPPFFAAIMAHFYTRDEKLSVRKLTGVVLGFLGAVLIVGPQAFSDSLAHIYGEMALIGASFLYAVVAVYGRRLRGLGLDPVQASAGQLSLAGAMSLPLALLLEDPLAAGIPGMDSLLAMLSLALLSTALAFLMYHALLARVGANNTVLVTFLIPVSAIILGVTFLGETLDGNQVAGMLVIATGLAVIDGRILKKTQSKQ